MQSDDDDDYRLSELVERPASTDEHLRFLEDAERDAGREDAMGDRLPKPSRPQPVAGDVRAAAARDLLDRAEAEAEQAQHQTERYVIRPLFTGLFSFFFESQAACRWVALTALSLGGVQLLHWSISLAGGGPIQQFLGIFAGISTVLFGLTYIALTSVCWLAILQDTSNGLDKIEQWPGLSFLDWVLDAFYVLNSLFLSTLPGALLGQWVVSSGAAGPWVALLLGFVTAVGLFPVMLLSALDAGTPLGIWSNNIVRNLLRHQAATQPFFVGSALLAVAAFFSAALMSFDWWIVRLMGAAGFNTTAMIYFRLLGRLAGLVLTEEQSEEAGAEPDVEGNEST